MERSFADMLTEIETADSGDGPDPTGTYTGQGIAALAEAIEAEAAAQAAITEAVALARQEGATWELIGDYLGMTRAGAYKRFKDLKTA